MISTGKRPFGVSLLYMGWDQHFGYQLYQSDPSGNYTGWKATCIGNNHQVLIVHLLFCLFRSIISSALIIFLDKDFSGTLIL